jgi:DsbC/DsbD-like thiol-disulfide interchange protein
MVQKLPLNALRPSACFFRTLFAAIILVGTIAAPARGATIQHGTLDLVAENAWISPGQSFTIGLHFKLEHGWHIYWKNPGDSGEPPRVAWQLPQGITAGEIEWPAPQRMITSTIMNYVYDDEVLLLVPMRADQSVPATLGAAKLEASVRLLICSDKMCVPSKAQISLSLPVKTQSSSLDQTVTSLFTAARARLPKPAPASWQFTWTDKKNSVVLRARTSQRNSPTYFFPLEDSQIDFSAKQEITPVTGGFQLTLRKSNQLTEPILRLRGVLVLADGQAYRLDVPAGNK